ncbi:MAG: sterol carrier family protein [Actinomycetes bacterium]|jgi:putative sterol carrier protein
MRDPVLLQEVKEILSKLSELAPGNSVEVRIPPYSAIQCVAGSKHRRGTPPNVVEMSRETLLDLISNKIDWASAIASGAVQASGDRADLSELFVRLAQTIRIRP